MTATMIGSTISHYEITDKLGEGGMGEIYKARDTRLNRYVALKILPPDKVADPERRQRFLHEAQASSSLNHPNIIVLYDIIQTDDSICLVLELVDGHTLSNLIPRNGLPVDLVLRYATQVAAALTSAHEAGIIHRDLKPANIMITDAGLVKILDFGLAKLTPAFSGDDAALTASRITLTTEGSILGTVNYMSPEQAEGRQVDARSDIFSFGVVLYEMITGARAFEGSTILSTLTQVLRDNPTPVQQLAAAPPELADLVTRALKKNPDERPNTMREVYAALTELKARYDTTPHAVQDLPLVVADAVSVPPQSRRQRMVQPLMWVLALASIPFLALGVFIGNRLGQGFNGENQPPVVVIQAPPPPQVSPAPAPQASDRPSPIPVTPDPPTAPQAATPAHTVAPLKPAKLADGTPVPLALSQDLAKSVEPGATITLHAVSDVTIGNTVVIPKGATASALVIESGKKTLLTRRSKVMLRLTSVRTADGRSVPLRASANAESPSDAAKPIDAAASAASLVHSNDENVAAAKGTRYMAFVQGDFAIIPATP